MTRLVVAVLWDADGVLQDVPAGWEASMRPAVGDVVEDLAAFQAEALAAERPCLTGAARWLEVLPALLERWGIADRYDAAVRVWLTIEPVPAARELVPLLRAAGVRCYLATNQDQHRARYMRRALGYDALLDGSFHSYELGVAKPDPAFYRAVLDRLALPAGEVLVIDDGAANVAAAREVGLRAERWHSSEGGVVLRRLLAGHGLAV